MRRKYCVACGSIYPQELRACPQDGSPLAFENTGHRLQLGHVLGNYRLIRKLGEGGVGTVYEGEHVRLGRKMALKVLHPETASAETIVRFFNEARAVNEIRHPNIVDVEDFVTTDDGEHYLIMELLKGEDLRGLISREGVMDPQRVSAIGEQIARALGAIHRAGILHRDLKPDNIFLIRKPDGSEVAKLLDFGIAKFLTDKEGMTRAGMTLGTPEYMAPEQIVSSGKPGPGADIYSLGMLMYECLAGAPAFTATTTAAILRGHISEPIVPPSHRRGEPLPPVLESAVLKCLEKESAHRFADGDALAAALRSDRAVELSTPRYTPGKRQGRTLQMLPAFAMAAAAAVIHFLPRDDRAAAAPAPVVAMTAVPPSQPAPPALDPVPPPAPAVEEEPAVPAPTHIEVTLVSNPEGAQLFLGKQALGESPAVATIPLGNQPVTLVARFSDGAEVTQTIVPDRPIAQIAFVKPQKQQSAAPPPPPSVKQKTTTQKPRASSGDKLESRDGTMDPFAK
ncbi:MAG TPA: serine/threonine-protein kinase [Kofleriaceae bacterium]|nr:serine/threonine-protein kinase [Kofleriaceae bacterium]